MINCKGYYDYWNEFDCGYSASICCEDCICNGGKYSPITGKVFRGNRSKYIREAEKRGRTSNVQNDVSHWFESKGE